MPLNFYARLFGLNKNEEEELDILTDEDAGYTAIVEDSAQLWRSKLRNMIPDEMLCRQVFIAQTLMTAKQNGVGGAKNHRLAVAFSLCMADRVEKRVREIDREQNNVRWN